VYAVINDSDQQTTVRAGDIILCDLKRGSQPGDAIIFDRVLLVGDEGTVKVGKPNVEGATVTGEVLGEAKGKKLIAFRFRRRKNIRVKRGHRQRYTRIRITEINA
jgi:large subunit ribosomal protein L21